MLAHLFGSKNDGMLIGIWSLPDRVAAYFETPEEATKYALGLEGRCVYVHMGMSTERTSPNLRWKATDIRAVSCLWADIDYACEGQTNKKRLPPNREAALEILKKLPFRPSLLIHTGHGMQAFWRFKEPWVFKDELEHAHATEICSRWCRYVQTTARVMGYEIDSVGDLPRVMRVVGTVNHKNGGSIPVTRVDIDNAHWIDLDAVEEILPSMEYRVPALIASTVGGLILNGNAQPPHEKFQSIMVNDRKFAKTWLHQRNDMHDTSLSSYDMSLAIMMAMAHWTDQEICDTLITHRRKYEGDLKLRESYYSVTIAKAKQAALADDARNVMAEIVNSDAPMGEKRTRSYDYLTKTLGLKVLKIIKYNTDPPSYRMETENGGIKIETVSGISNQIAFRDAVMAVTNVVMPMFKKPAWDTVVQCLLHIREEQEVASDATDFGMIQSMLDRYIQSKGINKKFEDSVELFTPYKHEGRVRFFGNDFIRWVNLNHGRAWSARHLGVLLRAYGCKPVKEYLTGEGVKTSRCVWEMPLS